MSAAAADEGQLQLEGDPAPELLEGRIWVDGCFDFFHHGTCPATTCPAPPTKHMDIGIDIIDPLQAMLAPWFRPACWATNCTSASTQTRPFLPTKGRPS